MGVGEVDAALGQAIDIWGDGGGCCVVASDPVLFQQHPDCMHLPAKHRSLSENMLDIHV